MCSCIIFDLDGTLVDSRADLLTGVNIMRAHFGLSPLSLETVVSYVGNGTPKLCERALSDSTVSVDEALPILKAAYREHILDSTRLYDGVENMLKKLHSTGIPLAVISNKPENPSRIILDGLGVGGLFDFIIGGDSGFKLKPDPESLLHIIAHTGCKAELSLMVGDNYTDLESGVAAGMKTVFCSYGFGNTRGLQADFNIASPGELLLNPLLSRKVRDERCSQ